MLGAGLLARKAVRKGLKAKPWVKTSLAPGSQVVTDYLDKAGLQDDLDALGFNLVGYGCTTCIGNSGPLPEPISKAINDRRSVAARCCPATATSRAAFSPTCGELPGLAAAGGRLCARRHARHRPDHEPLGTDSDGKPVYLKDIWPTTQEIRDVMRKP